MARDVTVVIPARDAAATIARAVASVGGTRVHEIVLVEHACADATVAIATNVARHPLRVVVADAALRLGGVRQVGVESVRTPFGIWLDADDEYLEGRVDRLAAHLDAGADLVADAAEVQYLDGSRRLLPVPPFMQRAGGWVRLFERNHLPGPGVIAFRTQVLQSTGYDGSQHGPEDTDILLRALDAGALLRCESAAGYRIHASDGSLSRNLVNQRAMYRALLLKHEPERIRGLYLSCGWAPRVAAWALHDIALFAGNLDAAARELARVAALDDGVRDVDVAEPDGPQPRPEGWRLAFARGTLDLLAGGGATALAALAQAEAIWPCPEGANNLGVALARDGQREAASTQFTLALARKADYLDANVNLGAAVPERITSHPFRHAENRGDYAAP